MKHINALLLPSEGAVYIDGQDTAKEPFLWKIRQKAGMVFQNPDNQIVAAVVEEDVAFGPENLGIPSDEIKARVSDALRRVNMTIYAKHGPHLLSGGQKQRVAIARALINAPAILFADEPTGNLDTRTKDEIHQLLLDVRKEKGQTVVVVTHDAGLAQLCDRTCFLEDGAWK